MHILIPKCKNCSKIPTNKVEYDTVLSNLIFPSFIPLMFFLFTISCSQSNDVIANEEHSNPSIDRDGDGMSADEGDCDETNPWTFDGAPDIWYDGVNSDCEGNDDFDQDRDGFIPNQYVSLSPLPFGDCDDTNPLFIQMQLMIQQTK